MNKSRFSESQTVGILKKAEVKPALAWREAPAYVRQTAAVRSAARC